MSSFLWSSFSSSVKALLSVNIGVMPKILGTLKLAALTTPVFFVSGFSEWIESDGAFIAFVVCAIFIDWIVGTVKHVVWLHDFHWGENLRGVLAKLIGVVSVGFVFQGLEVLSQGSGVYGVFDTFLKISIFLYPSMSIIRSVRVISGNRFPSQAIYDRLDKIENFLKEKTNKQIIK